MENGEFYSITTKRFVLCTKQRQLLEMTQELYNRVLLFYYRLFLDREDIRKLGNRQACRELERLTIVGREKQPVPYPLPWEKVPLYFRRAAVNGAISAGRSFLSRGDQPEPAKEFHKSVTFYKGMYEGLTEREVTLKLWNGEKWQWTTYELRGNHFPENCEIMSPAAVLTEKNVFLNVPVRSRVPDGRKARERMVAGTRVCSVQFTGTDAIAVCAVLSKQGELISSDYLKGGKAYEHRCAQIMERIAKSRSSTGNQKENQPEKRYWMKLKNVSEHFSNSISRQIINICIEEGAGVIAFAKYDEEYTRKIMLGAGEWSALRLSFRIKEQLRYKAWNRGILILEVNSKDTAGVCNRCGAVIQKEKEQYVCQNGHRGNRYLNSAVNLGKKCIQSFRKQAADI